MATVIGTAMETRITKLPPNEVLEHGSRVGRWTEQGRGEFRVGQRDLGMQVESRTLL